ncbi:MAG: hypothetical protein A2Z12_03340 [Actinobacteria bacterium RBG_16_68_21]|nr:MAG: hypothetical protein A2Z12_03340 [Actinobacteria bacterium RBG_16_68_21]
MTDQVDPGWRPALPIALGILSLRRPSGSMLIVLRAAVIFLATAAAATAVFAVVLSAGSAEPRIGEVTAQLLLGGAVIAAASVIALTGREAPDLRSEGHLAVWLFGVTMRRILASAAVGPVGFLLSWMAGAGSYVIFGAGAAILLMAVVAPTGDRLRSWQVEVTEAGSDIVVLRALEHPY